MSKLSSDARKVPSAASKSEDKCPLCGGNVVYRGITNLECDAFPEDCLNGSAERAPTLPPMYGAWIDDYEIRWIWP